MCIYIYIYVCTYIYMYTYMYVCVYIYICMHARCYVIGMWSGYNMLPTQTHVCHPSRTDPVTAGL